jgi:hypothetical protein
VLFLVGIESGLWSQLRLRIWFQSRVHCGCYEPMTVGSPALYIPLDYWALDNWYLESALMKILGMKATIPYGTILFVCRVKIKVCTQDV